MILYGTATLAVCMLIGKTLGIFLGQLLGVDSDVGGVGFSMLLLIFAAQWMRKNGKLPKDTEHGIVFWSGMYIPIVIAMASIQNVKGALSGGPMAILAGVATCLVCVSLVPVISKIGDPSEPLPPLEADESELEKETAHTIKKEA